MTVRRWMWTCALVVLTTIVLPLGERLNAAPDGSGITFDTSAFGGTQMPTGTENAEYPGALIEVVGTANFTHHVQGLPHGLTVFVLGTFFTIDGTPAAGTAGDYDVKITVTDTASHEQGSVDLQLRILTVSNPVLTHSYFANYLPNGKEEEEYPYPASTTVLIGVQGITADQINAGTIGWELLNAPQGMFLDFGSNGANYVNTTLKLSGLLANGSAGTYQITVRVWNFQTSVSVEEDFQLSVASLLDLQITTTTLPDAMEGVPYDVVLDAVGGLAPYSWGVVPWNGFEIPAGLSLQVLPVAGGIETHFRGVPMSGTALTAPYQFTFTVRDIDQINWGMDATALEMLIYPEFIVGDMPSSLNGIQGEYFSYQLPLSGGGEPYVFEAEGLPPGLSLDEQGRISGTPPLGSATDVPYHVEIHASESSDYAFEAAWSFDFYVGTFPLSIVTDALPMAIRGQEFFSSLAIHGGLAPFTVSAEGLPEGFSIQFNSESGRVEITGTGSAQALGSHPVQIFVQDSNQPETSDSVVVSLVVVEAEDSPLRIITETLPAAQAGEPYRPVLLAATGGTDTIYDWSDCVGFPPGLETGIDTTSGEWAVFGTPTRQSGGTYVVHLIVRSGHGESQQAASSLLSMVVVPTLDLTSGPLQQELNERPQSDLVGGAPVGCALAPSIQNNMFSGLWSLLLVVITRFAIGFRRKGPSPNVFVVLMRNAATRKEPIA